MWKHNLNVTENFLFSIAHFWHIRLKVGDWLAVALLFFQKGNQFAAWHMWSETKIKIDRQFFFQSVRWKCPVEMTMRKSNQDKTIEITIFSINTRSVKIPQAIHYKRKRNKKWNRLFTRMIVAVWVMPIQTISIDEMNMSKWWISIIKQTHTINGLDYKSNVKIACFVAKPTKKNKQMSHMM